MAASSVPSDPSTGTPSRPSSPHWVPLQLEPADRGDPGGSRSSWSRLILEERRPKKGFNRLFGGWFGRLLLPAIIAQSVLIGGGYATGREVVEFGARFGSVGWIAVLAVFIAFTVMSILVFEFARVTRAYDYKSFVKGLIGPAWPVFDVLYAVMAVLVIAVMAAASGTIMEATIGVPYMVGILAIVAVVAVLLFYGSRLIEAFKTLGTTALYLGYIVFGVVVLTAGWPQVTEVFASADTQHAASGAAGVSMWAVIGIGILYVGYNLAIYPAVLFSLHRQGKRSHSVLGGLAAGVIMTLPFLLTYLCVLAFYADGGVVDAEVPWLYMLDATAGTWVVVLFGIVVGWTLMETSVGLIHAILDRLDRDLVHRNVPGAKKGEGLSGLQKGALGSLALLAAAALAQVGIVSLVGVGYLWMAYAFLAVFALPLLTVGVWRIVAAQKRATGGPMGSVARQEMQGVGTR